MHSTFEHGELAILVVPWLEPVAFVLEIFGIAVIVLSVIRASLRYARDLGIALLEAPATGLAGAICPTARDR